MLRLAPVASLLLAIVVGAAPAIAKAPKPNPCKGPKAKKTCPSSIPYFVTVAYAGTETMRVRTEGRISSERTRTIRWSFRTAQPVSVYHVGEPSRGNVAFGASGKGTFMQKVTSTSYACDGTQTVTNDETLFGESSEAIIVVSSSRGGPILRHPWEGAVLGHYLNELGGYSCTVNGNTTTLAPKTERGSAVRLLARLVTDGGRPRHAIFTVGAGYGERSIHPPTIEREYHAEDVDSSWSWTLSFQRAN
jgi:hypothetical protein